MEDIEIPTIRGPVKVTEMISEVSQKMDADTKQTARKNIGEVTQFINDGHYDLIVFTGKSGFLSDRMLGDLEGVQKVWIKDQNQKYKDPELIQQQLDKLGMKPEECKLIVVDEHMSSGLFKARQMLTGLSKSGLNDFAFASFIGPLRYQTDSELSYQEVLTEIAPSPELENKIFFPKVKDKSVWDLLRGLEKLSDYYEQSDTVRNFIDKTLEELKQKD